MYEKILLLSFVFILASGQENYAQISKPDTILTQPGFLGNTYLLDGKKMNLHVLKWFMQEYPLAHEEIQAAAFSDQLSAFGYTVGGILFFSGFFLYETNRPLSRDLLAYGTYGIGGGLLFQFVAGRYEKKAVRIYNQEVKKHNLRQAVSFQLRCEGNQVKLAIQW